MEERSSADRPNEQRERAFLDACLLVVELQIEAKVPLAGDRPGVEDRLRAARALRDNLAASIGFQANLAQIAAAVEWLEHDGPAPEGFTPAQLLVMATRATQP